MKKFLSYFGFILLLLIGILYISEYDYLLRAVSKIYLKGHSTAYLSDYKNFNNRTLPASQDPQSWPLHKNYNSLELPDWLK